MTRSQRFYEISSQTEFIFPTSLKYLKSISTPGRKLAGAFVSGAHERSLKFKNKNVSSDIQTKTRTDVF